MKNVMIMMCAVFAYSVSAQTVHTKAVFTTKRIEVTYNKTTNLVFPAAITSVDRGSQDILVQKATGGDNVLRVKADVKNFTETNLSVITADGQLFSFVVNYAEHPSVLNITVEGDVPASAVNSSGQGNYTGAIIKKRGNVHSVNDESSKVSLKLKGFYVKDDIIFCKLYMSNRSRINYDIDQFHFYIRDKKKSKRTASQEVIIAPVSIAGDTGTMQSEESRMLIVSMPKFTIPEGKLVVVEMMERNGGRHLYLRAKNRHLMKARPVNGDVSSN
jgi:conjugative transposon TraN protein